MSLEKLSEAGQVTKVRCDPKMQSICPAGYCLFLNCHLAVVNPDKLPKVVLRGEEKGCIVNLTGLFIFLQDDDNVDIF